MGAFYIFGRDKYYRPCIVLDAAVMAQIVAKDPDCISTQNFTNLFIFLYQYITRVMFAKGHVD
jgi:hypothetical protein